MCKKILISLLAVLIIRTVGKSQTQIYGTAQNYAGDIIKVSKTDSPLGREETVIFEIKVEKDGTFMLELNLKQTTQLFLSLDYYKGIIYALPNEKYQITLPLKKGLSDNERLNPYFRPMEIYLNIENKANNIGRKILKLEGSLDIYMNKNYWQLHKKSFKNKLERDIKMLDSINSYSDEDIFFTVYKESRFNIIKHSSYLRNTEKAMKAFFENKNVYFNNSAFNDLFNSVFTNFFISYNNEEMDEAVRNKDYKAIDKALKKDNIFKNDTLRGYAILKGLHDAFYNKTETKETIYKIVGKFIRETPIDVLKKSAINLRSKITKLQLGTPAPLFSLPDSNKEEISLTSLKGKYVYLAFYNTKNYGCLEQIKLLKDFEKNYNNLIKVVIISTDENFDDMLKLAEKEDYKNLILHFGDSKVVEKYAVRSYPSYFLIDPEGKIVWAPAPSPKEQFAGRFVELWRDRRNKEIRKQAENKKKEQKQGKDGKR